MKRPVVCCDSRKVFVLLAGLLLVPSPVRAGPVAARGAALAYACAACHGPDGRSQGAIPRLDRLSAEHFRDTLHAFQTEGRQATVMHHIAKGLEDRDIEAVAAYFAAAQQGEQSRVGQVGQVEHGE